MKYPTSTRQVLDKYPTGTRQGLDIVGSFPFTYTGTRQGLDRDSTGTRQGLDRDSTQLTNQSISRHKDTTTRQPITRQYYHATEPSNHRAGFTDVYCCRPIRSKNTYDVVFLMTSEASIRVVRESRVFELRLDI